MLALPILQQSFDIEIDASQYAIGIVLEHEGHPMAYHSSTLSQGQAQLQHLRQEVLCLSPRTHTMVALHT